MGGAITWIDWQRNVRSVQQWITVAVILNIPIFILKRFFGGVVIHLNGSKNFKIYSRVGTVIFDSALIINRRNLATFYITLQSKLSSPGLCCSSSQPTSSLITMTPPSVAMVCQLTYKLLIRQVTVSASGKQLHAIGMLGADFTKHIYTHKIINWWFKECLLRSLLLWICKV